MTPSRAAWTAPQLVRLAATSDADGPTTPVKYNQDFTYNGDVGTGYWS